MPTVVGPDGLIPVDFLGWIHGIEVVNGEYDHKWKVEEGDQGDYILKVDTINKQMRAQKK